MSFAGIEKGRLKTRFSHDGNDITTAETRNGQTHGVTSGREQYRNGGTSPIAAYSSTPSSPVAATLPPAHLPPYSGPASSAQEAALEQQQQQQHAGRTSKHSQQRYPGLPALDYRLYQPPLFTLNTEKTAIRTSAPYLSATPSALAELVRSQATVPPKPIIEITGCRGRKVDFALKLNLLSLLVPDDPRRRLHYVRCVGVGELALRGGSQATTTPSVDGEAGGSDERGEAAVEAWCRRFCEDPATVKEFVLERQVANLDLGWLEGQIRSLVAATGYRGLVAVAFPVLHARVVVHSPDRVNKFFTTVTTLFTGKSSYEVVKAVWPFATHRNGEPGRRCAVQSEETWWKEWRDPIRYAISTRRVGWVTNEDKLEVLMEGAGKGIHSFDWGPDHV